MIETINVLVGKSECNAWRRNNLLQAHNCVEKDDYYECSFQWIEHASNGVKQINLIYKIVK